MDPVGTEGLPLFAEPVARRRDPSTSHQAAASVRFSAQAQNAKILTALARLPGRRGTYYEIAKESGLSPVQVARRLGSRYGLVGARLVSPTTEERQLPTGRMGRVFELPHG